MTLPSLSAERTLNIYLALAQYPILSTNVRAQMRRELFKRGVITPQAFEAEAREKAIRSQAMEGMRNPFTEEPAEIWELRLWRVRDHLTDFYFAYNLPYELFEQIVRTPTTASLALATFAPTVSVSDNVTATPTTLALTTATFAPTVVTPVTVTPNPVELTLTTLEPTVSVAITVTPSTAS